MSTPIRKVHTHRSKSYAKSHYGIPVSGRWCNPLSFLYNSFPVKKQGGTAAKENRKETLRSECFFTIPAKIPKKTAKNGSSLPIMVSSISHPSCWIK
jgi:hypothetical protein